MNPLPQSAKQRIKADAEKYLDNVKELDYREDISSCEADYIEGATAEASKSADLIEALEKIKELIEQDLIKNGNNDLGNRIHLEAMIVLKNYNQ